MVLIIINILDDSNFLEPELRPEFVERVNEIQKFTMYDSVEDLEKDIKNA